MTGIENMKLEELEEKLNTVEGKVDKILIALLGSELMPDNGLLKEIQELKNVDKETKARVLKLENLKNRVIYMSIGAGIAGGFSITKIIEWIQDSAK